MVNRFLHIRFLLRELGHGWQHSIIFILCVALSLSTIVGLDSFENGVNRSLFRDARELHGGDVILHSHYPFSPPILAEIERLEREENVVSTKTHSFYSIVRSSGNEKTLFANIKSVDENYPLYGRVDLQTANTLKDQLKSGSCIVAADVLRRLDLRIGDVLEVGRMSLRIVDVVTHESDSPVNILSFGPRVFVAHEDLAELDLVKKGSRVEYELLLKLVDETSLEGILARLKGLRIQGQERINSYKDAQSGVKRFFENLLFFLSLISIFTLLLAGLGMQSCLTALIRQKEKTIGVLRAIGAKSTFLFLHYLAIILFLGGIGSIIGVAAGLVLASSLPGLFEGLLPLHGEITTGFTTIWEGLLLGLAVVLLFTFLPLYRLRNIKPVVILRNENHNSSQGPVFYVTIFAGILLVTILIIRQLQDLSVGLYFVGGIIVLISAISFFSLVLIWLISKGTVKRLSLRQAIRSLSRVGNSTRSVIITLSSALSLLFAIYLVEHNLHLTYIESYPEDAPNLFCIDIQPDQKEGFLQFFEEKPELFPIIRARVMEINSQPVRRDEELRKKRDNFAREFNLTYRTTLLEDEVLIEGEKMFGESVDGVIHVSILDTVASMGNLKLGDILRFNIQGVEMDARVSSIRTRSKSMLYPFFYFVFPGDYLQAAPQTLFAAVNVEKDRVAALQSRVLERYPNISFINVSETAEDIEVLMLKLTSIVNFFASFSILAGILIMVSSILATRLARIRESVYYKILGTTSRFVYLVIIFENGMIGLFSSLVALLISHVGSWGICHYLFEISYSPNPVASVILALATSCLVIFTGLVSSFSIVKEKPVGFLREQEGV